MKRFRIAIHESHAGPNFEGRGRLIGIIESSASTGVRRERGRTILDIPDCNDVEADFALRNALEGNADLVFYPAPGIDRREIRSLHAC